MPELKVDPMSDDARTTIDKAAKNAAILTVEQSLTHQQGMEDGMLAYAMCEGVEIDYGKLAKAWALFGERVEAHKKE